MDYVIAVDKVAKKYRLHHDFAPTLKERVLFRNRSSYEDLWVLQDVSLYVEAGHTVGLIGQNGSGKSTLLKLMSRIIYPDQGQIRINGRVSSLLELGAGFHPDFTGLENIYMNAAIFGMNRREIDRRLDDILDFAELGEFIHSPVRTYSSGMYMRLAFSVAINVEPEVLLIDEILAVGDESFQKKCLAHMERKKASGVTTVIVSHDLAAIEKLCDRVVWLQHGTIAGSGCAMDVIKEYRDAVAVHDNQRMARENTPHVQEGASPVSAPLTERWGDRSIVIKSIRCLDQCGQPRFTFACGEPCVIEMKAQAAGQPVDDPVFGIGIFRPDNICCYGTNSYIDHFRVD
jgi:ABC-type polysaccharide/polyol phosphate transport system ATPase subunit